MMVRASWALNGNATATHQTTRSKPVMYTPLNPAWSIPGYGILSLEEDILVKDNGAVFMSEPQLEMILR